MVKSVLFDMDGLMFDTEPIWSEAWPPALAAFGLAYSYGMDQEARGAGRAQMCSILRRHYGPDCPAEAIVERFYEIAEEKLRAPVPKKPGLDELLAWLQGQGIPMAVVSSSSEALIRNHLKNGGVEGYFRAIVSGEMVSRSKPDPEGFLRGAAALGAAPADCLVLEDSHNGIRAGAAGGFVTVMVPDLLPDTDEMRRLYTMKCSSLDEVLEKLKAGEL